MNLQIVVKTLAAPCFLCSLVISTPHAQAAKFSALDIGSFGGNYTNVNDINNLGQLVGSSTYAENDYIYHAFVTSENGKGLTDLGIVETGSSYARKINDSGMILGFADPYIGSDYWFVTNSQGSEKTNLSALNTAALWNSYLYGISASGQIVGTISTGSVTRGATLTDGGATLTRLGTFTSDGWAWSSAAAINDQGVIVGSSGTYSNGFTHAFMTDHTGAMIDLGTLGGNTSLAYAVNNLGQVAGLSQTSNGEYHAFITGPDGLGMHDLGALSNWGTYANDINTSGHIVGSAYLDTGEEHAFYSEGFISGIIDLNDLVSLPEGVILTNAKGINDIGQIVANATNGRAYLLTPVPEPDTYVLMLSGLAIVGSVIRRRG